jgi:outer membrane protein TolC
MNLYKTVIFSENLSDTSGPHPANCGGLSKLWNLIPQIVAPHQNAGKSPQKLWRLVQTLGNHPTNCSDLSNPVGHPSPFGEGQGVRTLAVLAFLCTLFTAYAQTDSLHHYLETAARNNPGVKAAFLSYEASLQRIPQAGAYQDPQLEMGFFLQPMEIIDGRQAAEFKLMQMFPWFGTRKAAQTEAAHMAQMAFEQFREARDQLFLDVYTQWFVLCRLQQQLLNTRENKALLLQLEELALRRFASPTGKAAVETGESMKAENSGGNTSNSMTGMGMGERKNGGTGERENGRTGEQGGSMSSMGNASGGMSDVLRIQLETAELENNIESLMSEIQAEKAQFNALLNRPSDSKVIIPDTLTQIPFLLDETSAMAEIRQQNPMLGMLNEEASAYRAKAEMDRKMSYPMFGIGLQYMLINKIKPATIPMDGDMDTETGSMNAMNGKDMVMPMVSVSIPIFRGKYKAQQRENAFLREASREKYADALNMLEAELYRTKNGVDNAARKIALYRKQSELAQTTYNLTVQEFISGKGDLTNVIQVQRQLLDYNLKTAEAVAVYNTMVANVQKLIGN